MGTWCVSITGNDTAQDLLSDYTCAFFYYGENAVEKIDEYVRECICNESDAEEWCNYIYSLADFMWKKGILTEELRDRAIDMIDNDFGMELWNEAGPSTAKKRKKVLEDFKTKLMSPMGPKRKIKPNVHVNQIFDDGDIVAIKLITKDKSVPNHAKYISDMTDDEFQSYDGKYILMQKIDSYSSWQCTMIPEINNWWARFRLFDGVYDEAPEEIDINKLHDAHFLRMNAVVSPIFICESSMSYFRKRKYKVITNHKESVDQYLTMARNDSRELTSLVLLGVSNDWSDPDSLFLVAMGCEKSIRQWEGSIDTLKEIAHYANKYGSFDYQLSKEENEQNRAIEEAIIDERLDQSLKDIGTQFYMVHWGRDCAFASLKEDIIDNIYVAGNYQKKGIATYLVNELIEIADGKIRMHIPNTRYREALAKICKTTGVEIVQ